MLDFYSSAIICTCLYFFIYVVFKKKKKRSQRGIPHMVDYEADASGLAAMRYRR